MKLSDSDIKLIYFEITTLKPSIAWLLSSLYKNYLTPGEYSSSAPLPTNEFWEVNFTFLWMILVAEGVEK